MNINDFDRLYRRTKTGVGVTNGTVRLQLKPVGPKTLRVLTHVALENLTLAFTKARLGIAAGNVDHYLDELQTIAANELVVSRSDILLGEGDVFFAELTGTHTGDKLIFTCVGWEKDL